MDPGLFGVCLGLFPGIVSVFLQEAEGAHVGPLLSSGLHLKHVIGAISCKEISSAPTSLHSPPGVQGLEFPESLGMVQALRQSR